MELIAALIGMLGSLIAIVEFGRRLLHRSRSTDVDGLDQPTQAVRRLGAGVQLTYFQECLGDPTFRTEGEAFDEHIFVHDAFYVQAITDRSGTVTLYSVTTRCRRAATLSV